MTGDPCPAARALKSVCMGIVPADQLTGKVMEMAQKIASKSTATVGFGKPAFYRQLERPLVEAYEFAAEVMVTNMLARDARKALPPLSKSASQLDRQLGLQPGPDGRIISVPA